MTSKNPTTLLGLRSQLLKVIPQFLEVGGDGGIQVGRFSLLPLSRARIPSFTYENNSQRSSEL